MVEGEGEALAIFGKHARHAAIDTGEHGVCAGSFTHYDKLPPQLYEQAAGSTRQAVG